VEFVSIDNFSDTRKGDIMQIILPRLKWDLEPLFQKTWTKAQ
jgi:hypothetical protein